MPASRADMSGYRQNGFTLKYAFVVRPSFGWKTLLLPLLTLGLILGHPTPSDASTTFDSIKFWTGTGTNKAAMVIQWNDGGEPTSMVWGYRWNGKASGFDMFQSIAGTTSLTDSSSPQNLQTYLGSDPRLTTSWTKYGFGNALDSVIFQNDTTLRTQSDWTNGYWEYNVFGGEFEYPLYDSAGSVATYSLEGSYSYSAVEWFSSPIGSSDRTLVDGSWDAWSFSENFVPVSITEPTPSLPPPPTCKSTRLKSSTELEIIFTTTPNISYQLESKEDLLALEWSFQGSSFSATSAETTFIVPIQSNNPKKFFRLRQLP